MEVFDQDLPPQTIHDSKCQRLDQDLRQRNDTKLWAVQPNARSALQKNQFDFTKNKIYISILHRLWKRNRDCNQYYTTYAGKLSWELFLRATSCDSWHSSMHLTDILKNGFLLKPNIKCYRSYVHKWWQRQESTTSQENIMHRILEANPPHAQHRHSRDSPGFHLVPLTGSMRTPYLIPSTPAK